MPLSDTRLRSAKPKPKAFKLSDGAGLHLLVQPNGGKFWRFAYRFAGKQKLLSFGPYPTIPLADAHERRDVARRHLVDGTDPSIVRKAEKAITAFIGTNSKTTMIETFRPMTLGNMRANGVHSPAVYCEGCHHQARLDVSCCADDVLCRHSARAWSAQSVVLLAPTLGRIGMNARRLACLVQNANTRVRYCGCYWGIADMAVTRFDVGD